MRYYRLQRGFTTRQLADKLKTVPATVLGYEQGKFPIPYDIAVALSEMLKMPRKTIFDDFCLFIDTPPIRDRPVCLASSSFIAFLLLPRLSDSSLIDEALPPTPLPIRGS